MGGGVSCTLDIRPVPLFASVVLCTGGGAISLVFGTGVGGLLAQPAVNLPTLFSGTGIFAM